MTEQPDLDIHLTFLGGIGADRFEAFRSLLDDGELARCKRFRVEGARREFLAGRALLRTALSSERGDVAPGDWRFRLNAYGRPAIDWVATDREASELHFNLSHTRGLAALVVGSVEPIGVDVEWIGRGAPGHDVARRYFTASEADWIDAGRDPDERTERFFALWTLKEAYIKARGMGLALPLDGFVFDCDRKPPTIAFNGKIEDRGKDWRCRRRHAGTDHRLALVHPAGMGEIRFHEADPMGEASRPLDLPEAGAFA